MQLTTALAMFCTGLVMWPTWQMVHQQAVVPLVQGDEPMDLARLWADGVQPIREFMIRQIDANGNAADVHLFVSRLATRQSYPTSYDQVPLQALLPAFLLSEIKTAFLIGFQIYLPFLVIDLVVAAATTSMGMFLLPPGMVSLPLKLMLFVFVDGWRLVVDMLLGSFQ
jgi:flagellar biosynthetic protein FliP